MSRVYIAQFEGGRYFGRSGDRWIWVAEASRAERFATEHVARTIVGTHCRHQRFTVIPFSAAALA